MWDELPHLHELLNSKNYIQAAEFMKRRITHGVDEGEHEEIITILRKEMLLLNISDDSLRTSQFCAVLMQYGLELGLEIEDYAEQCQVLNIELNWYAIQYQNTVNELHSLDPLTALHVIISIFENFNQYLLGTKPDKLERIFYASYVYGMEANYESGITALNLLLKFWHNSCQKGDFRGQFNGFPYVADSFLELREKLVSTIRSLDYLQWLCKQVSLHQVSMEIQDDTVLFTIHDKEEYRRIKLPFVRGTASMQSAHRGFDAKRRFDWKIADIDYSRIVILKESGDDFKINLDPDTFFEAFKRSTETAYQTHLQIMRGMFITNLHELKLKNISVNATDLFFFYYGLQSMGLVYFEATKYFIETQHKEARAPYLVMDKKMIGEQLIPLLSKILKRNISQEEINQMIHFFTFGSNNIFDLYYKPLVVNDEKVILIPSLFIMNNFSKTFLHHLNDLGVNLSERGDNFETVTQNRFAKHGFKVHEGKFPYSFYYEGKKLDGDIDLVAMKGNYLFLGQLKNRIEPLEPKDYRGADKKINMGIKQSEQAQLYVRTKRDEFCKQFGITPEQLNNLVIQPFVLVSCFYGSGQVIRNIPVTDDSALSRFMDKGVISIHPGHGDPYSINIRTPGDVITQEFKEFLFNPYFLDEEIYGLQIATRHAYPIRDRKFVLGPDDNWEEQFSKSILAEALKHFEDKGLFQWDDLD
jgi:hypothetical protein